jgi:thiol:disulfide interchange protein DsbC
MKKMLSPMLLPLNKANYWFAVVILVAVSYGAIAQPIKLPVTETAQDPVLSQALMERIYARLRAARPDLKVANLRPSPMPGLYKIDLNDQLAFISEDGGFLIAGEMYQVNEGHLINLQEEERQQQEASLEPKRAERLAAIDKKDMVIYTPEKEIKGHVYVFTDIDCGFCRKLHGQMDEMLDKGIEVRYLAFPRAGINSRSAQKLATAWCAEDRQKTMTRFKQGENVKLAVCDGNPVADQYMLGQELGVRGTPAIVLESGQMIPGAVSPEMLESEMGI